MWWKRHFQALFEGDSVKQGIKWSAKKSCMKIAKDYRGTESKGYTMAVSSQA